MLNLTVDGMTCAHCERAVQGAIAEIAPTATITIDRAQNHVSIDNTNPLDRAAIIAAIEAEGYIVRMVG